MKFIRSKIFVFLRPGEIKWHLMVASCYRRSGDYTAALEKYKWIHQHFPDDVDCKILNNKEKFICDKVTCF
jgi:hypothetical protein